MNLTERLESSGIIPPAEENLDQQQILLKNKVDIPQLKCVVYAPLQL